MAVKSVAGSRILVSLIDEIAETDPSRSWAEVPVDELDLAKGFQSISFSALSNAVNHAVFWLQTQIVPNTKEFDAVAYSGPKDVRYPILAVAIAKVNRKLLLPTPYASPEVQAHLLRLSNCKSFLCPESFKASATEIVGLTGSEGIPIVPIPEISDWLKDEAAPRSPFKKTWEEGKDDPWLIFHTSGTTGFPKLVTYTHQMMTQWDTLHLMPDAHEQNEDYLADRRYYSPVPSLHVMGMVVSLQAPAFLRMVVVLGPAGGGPTTPQMAKEVLQHSRAQGAIMPPYLIDALCADPAGLDCLRQLEYVFFGGAPLHRQSAEKLVGYTNLKATMGTTEGGAYFLKNTGPDEWEYYSFRPAMGLEFRHVADDLYEPVFIRTPGLERWQQVFEIYPDMTEFPTQDLFSKHPTKPAFWKYVGRTDDMVPLSTGEDLNALRVEEVIEQHPRVSGVMIGGHGRQRPYLLVDWNDETLKAGDRITQLWPKIEEANKQCTPTAGILSSLVIFTSPDRRLPRSAKGTVSRGAAVKLYAAEIDDRYKEVFGD